MVIRILHKGKHLSPGWSKTYTEMAWGIILRTSLAINQRERMHKYHLKEPVTLSIAQ
jgi:hypothetical protein